MSRKNKLSDVWNHVERGDNDECWMWISRKHKDGYGFLKIQGKYWLAHRAVYAYCNGPIPTGKVIRHSCDTPACCNPNHLLIGTQIDNIQDRQDRGRHVACHGTKSGMSKLSESQVLAIRKDDRFQKVIADDYGIGQSTVSSIKTRQTWKHI